jgi:hypothetical protein
MPKRSVQRRRTIYANGNPPVTHLAQALYSATFGIKLTAAEAKALLDAYMNSEWRRGVALIDAKRAADDASAQRALVELLTNELDKRQQGDG